MPEKKEIGELHPNYREASKELRWAYRRLGDAEKFLTSGTLFYEILRALLSAKMVHSNLGNDAGTSRNLLV
jgi:hypothetical protein